MTAQICYVCKKSLNIKKGVINVHTLKSDSTHHFFRNACTKSGSLRFSQFSGCWLILSVYIIMSFDFPFVRLLGVRYFCYYPYFLYNIHMTTVYTQYLILSTPWSHKTYTYTTTGIDISYNYIFTIYVTKKTDTCFIPFHK